MEEVDGRLNAWFAWLVWVNRLCCKWLGVHMVMCMVYWSGGND